MKIIGFLFFILILFQLFLSSFCNYVPVVAGNIFSDTDIRIALLAKHRSDSLSKCPVDFKIESAADRQHAPSQFTYTNVRIRKDISDNDRYVIAER